MDKLLITFNKVNEVENKMYYQKYNEESRKEFERIKDKVRDEDLDMMLSLAKELSLDHNFFNVEDVKKDELYTDLRILLNVNEYEIKTIIGRVGGLYVPERSFEPSHSVNVSISQGEGWTLRVSSEYMMNNSASFEDRIVEWEVQEILLPHQLNKSEYKDYFVYFTSIVIYLIDIIVNNVYRRVENDKIVNSSLEEDITSESNTKENNNS